MIKLEIHSCFNALNFKIKNISNSNRRTLWFSKTQTDGFVYLFVVHDLNFDQQFNQFKSIQLTFDQY